MKNKELDIIKQNILWVVSLSMFLYGYFHVLENAVQEYYEDTALWLFGGLIVAIIGHNLFEDVKIMYWVAILVNLGGLAYLYVG